MTRQSPLAAIAAWLALTACGASPAPSTSTPTIYETTFENRNIDKVDILFDIDNSRQMWDAQDYLKAAVPDLVNRIINPGCVDPHGVFVGESYLGSCQEHPGTTLEFPPVHDLHLGIVTSSLGRRLGDACDPQQAAPPPFGDVSAHNDDQAHLLDRSLTYSPPPPAASSSVSEGVVADAPAGDPFLYWFPSALNAGWPGPGTPITRGNDVISDFTEIVGGAGVYGCDLQSPLESWYRFLVQPDPYASLVLDGSGRAQWSGVDTTLLHQRHDFLRPDSMVIVVVVSADDDKEVDVRSVGGTGYKWLSSAFDPPRGTSACATDPASPACKPCTEPGTAGDPGCAMGPYSTPGDGGHDLATRFSHMKAKYGVDPQYPLQRYVNGLTSTTVPDRLGEYPPGATSYVGRSDCQNPLFAAALPDGSSTDATALCHAPPGTARTKDMVSYVHIGGVPYQLLHFTPGNAAASILTGSDWVKILGKDPLHYDTTGIDPHMIESSQPRPGVTPPGSANGTDPISSHDWITDTGAGTVSLEYACIFPLVDARGTPAPRDCSLEQNTGCDCPRTVGSLSAEQLSPLCDQTTQTRQVGAKAYPTTRELLLAKLVGSRGSVASLCPVHVAEQGPGDPLYGYRSAFDGIVSRLEPARIIQCLPRAPSLDAKTAEVPCTVLVQLPPAAGGTCNRPVCDPARGLSVPPSDVLGPYCKSLEAQYVAAAGPTDAGGLGVGDPAKQSVCELRQLTAANDPGDFQAGTCAAASADPGWCYVTGVAAGACAQAIVFAAGSPVDRVPVHLACSER